MSEDSNPDNSVLRQGEAEHRLPDVVAGCDPAVDKYGRVLIMGTGGDIEPRAFEFTKEMFEKHESFMAEGLLKKPEYGPWTIMTGSAGMEAMQKILEEVVDKRLLEELKDFSKPEISLNQTRLSVGIVRGRHVEIVEIVAAYRKVTTKKGLVGWAKLMKPEFDEWEVDWDKQDINHPTGQITIVLRGIRYMDSGDPALLRKVDDVFSKLKQQFNDIAADTAE
jgi:hypothetical protein